MSNECGTTSRFTTYWSDAMDVVIERDSKLGKLPDFTQINVVFFREKVFHGSGYCKEWKNAFGIYDAEKRS